MQSPAFRLLASAPRAVLLTAGLLLWEVALLVLLGNGEPLRLEEVGPPLLLDAALLLPLCWLALVLARRRARAGGRLGAAAAGALLLGALLGPVVVAREAGQRLLAGDAAGVQAGRDGRLLCSLRGPGRLAAARTTPEEGAAALVRAGLTDALLLQLPALPLLLLALGARRRRASSPPSRRRRPLTLVPLALGLLTCTQAADGDMSPEARAQAGLRGGNGQGKGPKSDGGTGGEPDAGSGGGSTQGPRTPEGCLVGAPVRTYHVSAIPIVMTLNRFGDYDPQAFMYVLDERIDAVRAQEQRLAPNRVSTGLRRDAIQPLVLRANLGECLVVHFTNRLPSGKASMHIHGLAHTAHHAGSYAGTNPDTAADPGQTLTYVLPLPEEAEAERAYHIHDHGAGRQRVAHGLFGALVLEPAGSVYLDPDSGGPLVGTSWEAIIQTPGADPDFREHVLIYHEIGDEEFSDLRRADGSQMPTVDDLSGAYRPGSRAINYRSEPFLNRLELRRDESLAYNSYAFGDPATPIPRSYLGEPTKQRLLHGGSEVFHVHHLHGGADRWKRNPKVGPSLIALGLQKTPPQDVQSLRVDAQSMGPGSSWNADIECGAGGCQQAAADFLFHCHIQHHYLSGMWSFWRVFDTLQPDLAVLPDRAPPPTAVDSRGLIGKVVEGRRLLPRAQVSNPDTEQALEDFIEAQLPPRGVPFEQDDATVWNWALEQTAEGPLYLGEPETSAVWPNFRSSTPGERPVIRFNPTNGRYAFPLLRPHLAQRPPFPGNGHSGAPWLGEKGSLLRPDGLCPDGNVVPLSGRSTRVFPISSIATPIPFTRNRVDEDGLLYVLNEEREDVLAGRKPKVPLVIRSNVFDCAEVVFTNEVPDAAANRFNLEHSKMNMHTHFVQFDPQGSDGVDSGLNFEMTVFNSKEKEGRQLLEPAPAGSSLLVLSNVQGLREGIWLGVGLGEGLCATEPERACTEVRRIRVLEGNRVVLDRPLEFAHAAGQYAGVEFMRYLWYSDVDDGTVFWHDHVTPGGWAHGAFGAHIIEPRGSTYHDPVTGEEVRSGTVVDIRAPESSSVAWGQSGSFREFFLGLSDQGGGGDFNAADYRIAPHLDEQEFEGTINLRAEPFRERGGEPAWRFSSVKHGDPVTPLLRAYLGDDVVIRGLGVINRHTGLRVTGHRFRMERFLPDAPLFDTAMIGVSERFDFFLEGGAGGPQQRAGDYLYYQTVHQKLEGGAWGLMRVHDRRVSDLQPLPNTRVSRGKGGFPQLAFTGEDPPVASGSDTVCPSGAPVRRYQVRLTRASIPYDESMVDSNGIAYVLAEGGGPTDGDSRPTVREPLVLRVSVGECLEVTLTNGLDMRAGFQVAGTLQADPRYGSGAAIGYNPDSSVAPGGTRVYRYYADQEVGLALGGNLADPESLLRGAFAAVVVEPEGAAWLDPTSGAPLRSGRAATIVAPGRRFREFVVLFQDEDPRVSQDDMPYHADVDDFTGLSYSATPLERRTALPSDPSEPHPWDVFSSAVYGDPGFVAWARVGDPVVWRVGQPAGEQEHVFGLEGHRWPLAGGTPGAESVSSVQLIPGVALNASLVDGAGAGVGATGDYLFLDQRMPFLEAGLWGLFRVVPADAPGTPAPLP